MTASTRKAANWLHRHGVARIVNSSSRGMGGPVRYLLESRPWTPERVVRWAAEHNFQLLYPGCSRTHRLASLQRGERTTAGAVRWVAVFQHAGPL